MSAGKEGWPKIRIARRDDAAPRSAWWSTAGFADELCLAVVLQVILYGPGDRLTMRQVGRDP